MRVLLDTNACIAVMRGNARATQRLAERRPSDCLISTVAVYELFTGVAKCREPERERVKVQRLRACLQIVTFDELAARHAARVRAELERTGNICGPYDLLLAGHARALDATLTTNNLREFSRIEGLRVEDWMN